MSFNRDAFEEHEIAPAFVTDLSHPEATAKNVKNMTLFVNAVAPCVSNLNDQSSTILDSVGAFAQGQAVESFSPSGVRPLRKASLRKKVSKKKCEIPCNLNQHPEKEKLKKVVHRCQTLCYNLPQVLFQLTPSPRPLIAHSRFRNLL